MTVIHRHIARIAALFALPVLAAACSMLQPMAPYDPEIEKGVSAYHQSLDSFILKMDRLGRTKDPAGRYDGNLAFYDDARATVDTLTLRAEAQDVTHSCVVPDVVRDVLGAAGGGALPVPAAASSSTTPAATGTPAGTGVDCTVQMLRNVRGQVDTLAQIHQVETYLTGPLAQRTRDITAQSLRAILAVEFAKKRNQM